MARINIEEIWWTDLRRSALINALGNNEQLADGTAIKLWRAGQSFWSENKGLIPLNQFQLMPHHQALLGCCLAELRGDWVYVKGAGQHFDWMGQKKVAGQLGGLKSSLRPRDSKGRLLAKTQAEVQAESKQDPSTPKQIQASSSSSFSSSVSSLRNVPLEEEVTLDFEAIYQLYPKRKGSQHKGAGIALCKRKFKTKEQYDLLEKAVRAYRNYIKAEGHEGTEFVSQFKTFVGSLWEEWVPQAPKVVQTQPKPKVDVLDQVEPESTPEEKEAARLAREKIASMSFFARAMPK